MTKRHPPTNQPELFSDGLSLRASDILNSQSWPDIGRFPTNRANHHVRDAIWTDLVSSASPLLVTGYASIGQLIELFADWDGHAHIEGQVRLVLGTEPFSTTRHSFRSDRMEFTEETRRYWIEEQGISLLLSAKILRAIEQIEHGKVDVRFVHGASRLHAKIYVADSSATVGSSNFTDFGLTHQLEANARFQLTTERRRYEELALIASNLWDAGESWNNEMLGLLHDLLKVVPWQEALARACAELLEGAWAEQYLQGRSYAGHALWPSQQSGIAEALWVIQSVGSVLVADATGSGKTKMGAHLVRAVRDRLWSTGRVHRDITALVGPPAVIDQWEREALLVGLSISKVSHGLLSRSGDTERKREELAVRDAQILAVDEAHNFLNNSSKRTRQVRESLADNVLLFTATPISRGAPDLLNLVGLLGPDNFEDRTLDILKRLDRGRVFDRTLSDEEATVLRKEIQRFTVRRTKVQINEMVDRDPEAYVHPVTGKVCRYPFHEARKYSTGETKQDANAADTIRELTNQFKGIAQLEEHIAVPNAYRTQYTDDQWLQARLRSSKALARHHVIEALRSSRAALVEHVCGTKAAGERFGLSTRFKPNDTGDVLEKIRSKIERGAPLIPPDCVPPEWMTEGQLWISACEEELELYEQIIRHADRLSPSREQTKADLLRKLCTNHEKVLVFEHHPITLAVMESLLGEHDLGITKVFLAASQSQKKSVVRAFAPEAEGRAIALCSDAMNEGLNLQAASCMVHLDLPTTLRVAEQRVGRVDRMDSPHASIEVWWPNDGPSFATRAYERLLQRSRDSAMLLGSNLYIPDFSDGDAAAVVPIDAWISELEAAAPEPWDGIRDALDPVRQLIFGVDPLISQDVYSEWRESTQRVLSRVAPVTSAQPWAFFAVAAASHGAPRWILIESDGAPKVFTDLNEIADRLRVLLGENPENRKLDEAASEVLSHFLHIASKEERQLLPRRMLRALEQMSHVLTQWARQSQVVGDEVRATQWREIERLVSDDEVRVDPHLVAEGWLGLVAPVFEAQREESRHARYIQLKDIQSRLVRNPIPYEKVVATFVDLPFTAPLERRVSACIVGVPADT